MSKVEIIIDHRERQVIPFIEKTQRYDIEYTTRQLSIGDYLICTRASGDSQSRVLAVIERKTWKDLAASFYDGRKENVNKLIELRKVSGCRIVYMLEGNPFRRSDEKIQRMPFKNLQAHLDHLLFRDDIHVMYTRDGRGSMQRLFDFANNMTTIKHFDAFVASIGAAATTVSTPPVAPPLPVVAAESFDLVNIVANDADGIVDETSLPVEVDEKTDDADGDTADVIGDDEIALLLAANATTGGLELATATKRTPMSDLAIARNIMKHLSSVGPITAEALLDNGVTLKSLYTQRHDAATLSKIKKGTVPIGAKCAAKILNGMGRLTDVAVQTKLLAEIPSLSAKSAANIIAKYSLHQMMTGAVSPAELAAVMKTEKTKVGNALAESILRALNFVL